MPKCSNWAPGPATRRAIENGEEIGPVIAEFNPGKPMSKAAKKNARRRENRKCDDGAETAALDEDMAPTTRVAQRPIDVAKGPQGIDAQSEGPQGNRTGALPSTSTVRSDSAVQAAPSNIDDNVGPEARLHYVRGDATTVSHGVGSKVIAHVCNDLGRWGKGFVMAVSEKWPDVAKQYRQWHKSGVEGGFELGAVQVVPLTPHMCSSGKARAALANATGGLAVANLIGQHGIKTGSGGPPVRYDAIGEGLLTVGARALELCSQSGAAGARGAPSVHMPRIGAGLAGGEWVRIEPLILRMLAASPGLEAFVYDWDG